MRPTRPPPTTRPPPPPRHETTATTRPPPRPLRTTTPPRPLPTTMPTRPPPPPRPPPRPLRTTRPPPPPRPLPTTMPTRPPPHNETTTETTANNETTATTETTANNDANNNANNANNVVDANNDANNNVDDANDPPVGANEEALPSEEVLLSEVCSLFANQNYNKDYSKLVCILAYAAKVVEKDKMDLVWKQRTRQSIDDWDFEKGMPELKDFRGATWKKIQEGIEQRRKERRQESKEQGLRLSHLPSKKVFNAFLRRAFLLIDGLRVMNPTLSKSQLMELFEREFGQCNKKPETEAKMEQLQEQFFEGIRQGLWEEILGKKGLLKAKNSAAARKGKAKEEEETEDEAEDDETADKEEASATAASRKASATGAASRKGKAKEEEEEEATHISFQLYIPATPTRHKAQTMLAENKRSNMAHLSTKALSKHLVALVKRVHDGPVDWYQWFQNVFDTSWVKDYCNAPNRENREVQWELVRKLQELAFGLVQVTPKDLFGGDFKLHDRVGFLPKTDLAWQWLGAHHLLGCTDAHSYKADVGYPRDDLCVVEVENPNLKPLPPPTVNLDMIKVTNSRGEWKQLAKTGSGSPNRTKWNDSTLLSTLVGKNLADFAGEKLNLQPFGKNGKTFEDAATDTVTRGWKQVEIEYETTHSHLDCLSLLENLFSDNDVKLISDEGIKQAFKRCAMKLALTPPEAFSADSLILKRGKVLFKPLPLTNLWIASGMYFGFPWNHETSSNPGSPNHSGGATPENRAVPIVLTPPPIPRKRKFGVQFKKERGGKRTRFQFSLHTPTQTKTKNTKLALISQLVSTLKLEYNIVAERDRWALQVDVFVTRITPHTLIHNKIQIRAFVFLVLFIIMTSLESSGFDSAQATLKAFQVINAFGPKMISAKLLQSHVDIRKDYEDVVGASTGFDCLAEVIANCAVSDSIPATFEELKNFGNAVTDTVASLVLQEAFAFGASPVLDKDCLGLCLALGLVESAGAYHDVVKNIQAWLPPEGCASFHRTMKSFHELLMKAGIHVTMKECIQKYFATSYQVGISDILNDIFNSWVHEITK
ncbi:unknown protein [Seminavis robusta]|uniref:Uncharacterized protein n=1 Tax=Seminavis robusta TaxID=568900 RepID=A0A9N8HKS6_9STRA|nr:unknown protein [Seminavis robusta]|eukprot:Sro775_g200740.1 n/a (1053) ;mRNA; r:98-3256